MQGKGSNSSRKKTAQFVVFKKYYDHQIMVRDMGKTCSMRDTKNSDNYRRRPRKQGWIYQGYDAYGSEIFEWTIHKY